MFYAINVKNKNFARIQRIYVCKTVFAGVFMKKEKSRYKSAKRVLVFWTLFIGIGALAGALAMLIDPTGKIMGMDAMLPYFHKLPFADVLFNNFTFSGIALLIVNGITNLTAAVLLLKNKKIGVVLGGVFGVTLMLWICIQFYIFPFNFMSTAYFIFGFCQAVTGYAAYVFFKQENFYFNENDYFNIGTDKSKLVVFFSRMGYTKKIAFETANRTGADIYEIKTTEKISGTLGFWWCGRFGMHRWDMPIEKIDVDLSLYKEVTICSPVWVFSIAAPIRSFLKQANGKIAKINYIFVHYTSGKYKKIAEYADRSVGVKHEKSVNVRCRQGKYKYYL